MWRKAIATAAARVFGAALHHPWRTIARLHSTTASPSAAVDSAFVQGSLDGNGQALKRTYGREEITISVMRMANIIPGDGEGGEDDDADDTNKLFLHLDVSKPGQKESLHFLCDFYPDSLGVHSVSLRRNAYFSSSLDVASTYNGPVFEDLDETTKDAFHGYVEERGVSESLFPFLRAWLYVKDHVIFCDGSNQWDYSFLKTRLLRIRRFIRRPRKMFSSFVASLISTKLFIYGLISDLVYVKFFDEMPLSTTV